MNVIIGNKYREMLGGLQVDVIKSLTGEFVTNDLLSQMNNFFFGKMILDITAIKDYKNVSNIQQIVMNLEADKIILLLDPQDEQLKSQQYLSQLVSLGLYNFTYDLNGINYLLQHPNTYKDVANYQNMNTAVASNAGINSPTNTKIIGFKNITSHAGATTLIYMIKKIMERMTPTLAIEINKNDFLYFSDKEMLSVTNNDVGQVLIKYNNYRLILIDVNDSNMENLCHYVVNLIEPSTLKLNKLMKRDSDIFNKLKNQIVVLNMSTLSRSDISRLEMEANINFFYNIPPLNDRGNNSPAIMGLLSKMGIVKQK